MGHPAAAAADGARAGVPLLQLSISLISTQPAPCPAHRAFIASFLSSANCHLKGKIPAS